MAFSFCRPSRGPTSTMVMRRLIGAAFGGRPSPGTLAPGGA
jgi:hypothetical protein